MGRDKSTGTRDEVFGIDMKIGVKDLRRAMAPSGLTDEANREFCDTMADAASLPGMYNSEPGEELLGDVERALSQMASDRRQEDLDEDLRKDTKWSNVSRNSLKGITSYEELATLLENVKRVRQEILQLTVICQKVILGRFPWPEELIEAWSFGSLITRLSRDCADLYVRLLENLVGIAKEGNWPMAQTELEHYVNEFALVRRTAPTRINCLCRIYVLMRDAAETQWRLPKLESKKLFQLFKSMEALQVKPPATTNGAGKGEHPGIVKCPHCLTYLHLGHVCIWRKCTTKKAREEGKKAQEEMLAKTEE